MAKATTKKEAEQDFHAILADGGPTPEQIMIAVMRGEKTIKNGNPKGGHPYTITEKMIAAAEKLLPYRLPKLNAVDQVNRNVAMSHEDWIKSLDGDEDEGD